MKKIISTLLLSICICYADQHLYSNGYVPPVEDNTKVDKIIFDSSKEVEVTVSSLFDSVPITNGKPKNLALAPDKKNPISIKAAEPAEARNINTLLKEAQSALDNHADVTALELFEKACGLGGANGCVTAGNIYRLGRGTTKDYKKAMSLFETAAKQDSITAMFSLGKMYYLGRGAEQDYKKAISFFEKAALKGDVNSQSYLGFIYATAPKPIRDNEKSAVWLDKAKKNKNYKSPAVKGDKVSTVGGVVNIKNKKFLYHDKKLIKTSDEEIFVITGKFSFHEEDLIGVFSGCWYPACNRDHSFFLINKYGGISETPSIGEDIVTNFDGETLLAFSEYESGISNLFVYEDDKATINGESLPMTGMYPLDFFNLKQVNAKFKELLGDRYESFETSLHVTSSTKFAEDGNTVIGEGCMAHSCSYSKAIFAIKTTLYPSYSANFYALLCVDGKISKYGFEDWEEAPKELKEWAIEHGEIIQSAEEPSIRCDGNHVEKCTNDELREMLRESFKGMN